MYPNSRYQFCVVYTDDAGRQYLDEREPFRYIAEPDNVYHACKEGDTLWGLAHIYFSEMTRPCGLWWLIAEFQPEPIVDPTISLTAGQVIIVPSVRLIETLVFSPSRRRYH